MLVNANIVVDGEFFSNIALPIDIVMFLLFLCRWPTIAKSFKDDALIMITRPVVRTCARRRSELPWRR